MERLRVPAGRRQVAGPLPDASACRLRRAKYFDSFGHDEGRETRRQHGRDKERAALNLWN
jgi:hypothetical protein